MKTLMNLAVQFTLMAIIGLTAAAPLFAQEREVTETQQKFIENADDIDEETEPTRPARLPDLTKGEPIREREARHEWHLGPTGIMGYMPGGWSGDQIEVISVLKGSPAEGKLQWGDVILGVGGEKFVAGGNMGLIFGNAIIEAEKEENSGRLKLQIWRDSNFLKRNSSEDVASVDVDTLIDEAESDVTLYDWKSEKDKKQEVRNEKLDEFPIEGQVLEIELELAVMPPYSDTSPYDCPKAERIRENAWKLLAKQFTPNERGRGGGGGSLQAVALAASGKPEYLKLLREWVRSPRGRIWHPPTEPDDPLNLPGRSWYMSFYGLECALYYDATGDEFVLPALERFAVRTAKGQAGGGSWGHGWAQPRFNGGKYHGMNPGYGALNASGNRCFFLIALAKKLGVEHPQIDDAIERARRFFGSYIDKGAIPYGHHAAWPSDDSNGKNSGVAFALKLLGDHHGAKYFAQMSTHASFSRRSGHGHDWFWHWSPWAATICGPRGTIASHRNLRWWFTLCRRFDGGFVIHSPTGAGPLRDATATYALHYSAPLKQTLITGKDADESYWWTDEEFAKLMTSARGQLFDPKLIEESGPRWRERSTDELFELLDHFKPKSRGQYARELGRRYKAGETEILARFAALLESDKPRERDAACRGLIACGKDATLQYMSAVARLLDDKAEFVRMRAVKAMAIAADEPEIQARLLKATVVEDPRISMSPNNLPAVTQRVLFGNKSDLARKPFESQFDPELVEAALEKLITLDPIGGKGVVDAQKDHWSKQTVIQLAGPLVFAAEQEQIADQMFSGRRSKALDLLNDRGYQEAIDAGVSYLRKYLHLPRPVRPHVTYKHGLIEPEILEADPAASVHHLDALRAMLVDKPMVGDGNWLGGGGQLYALIHQLETVKQPRLRKSLASEVDRQFQAQLDKAANDAERLAMCRGELADPDRYNYFRKLSAMRYLSEQLADGAMADIIPYLGHEHWRLGDLADELALKHATQRGQQLLIDALATAEPARAVAILHVLGAVGSEAGNAAIEKALSHAEPQVRGAAAAALFESKRADALPKVFALMADATALEELAGCEQAVLAAIQDPSLKQQVRDALLAMAGDCQPPARDSVYWLIGQIGDAKSLAALRAAAESENEATFRAAVTALSYCPYPQADAVVLDIIRNSEKKRRASFTAKQCVRRMVVSPDIPGQRPVKEQLDYAEAVLDQVLDSTTIAYLGRIRTGRCAFILQRAMRRGATKSAPQAIIHATSDLTDAPEADRKLAVSALIDTIEFIEVTYLRGGATEQMRDNPMKYAKWKEISVQAGKNLLKLDQTDKAPLPEFDDFDLDM